MIGSLTERGERRPRAGAGSTYIDTPMRHGMAAEDYHYWAEFTADRLAWLYPSEDRTTATLADIAAWARLGRGA